MLGVKIIKIKPVHEDDRRSLTEVFNGEFVAKQLKILHVKNDSILGNHYHPYRQFFYMLKGGAEYAFVNIKNGERRDVKAVEGDLIFINKKIAHATKQKAGNITVEGNEESYTSPEIDDLKYVIEI